MEKTKEIFPSVACIIINWNGLADTIACIDSLEKIEYNNYKIIVVDNGSTPSQEQLLEERYKKDICVLKSIRNIGYAGGCNIGIKYAFERRFDYYLLLNNDVIFGKFFLIELIKEAESNPFIGILGPVIYEMDDKTKVQSIGANIQWMLGYFEIIQDENILLQRKGHILECDYIIGAVFLIKKKVLDAIGLMDENFFFNLEEVDYCVRAKKVGYKTAVVPSSRVWHKSGASIKKLSDYPIEKEKFLSRKGFNFYKTYFYFFRKHYRRVIYLIPFILKVSELGPLIGLLAAGKYKEIFTKIKQDLFRFFKFFQKIP